MKRGNKKTIVAVTVLVCVLIASLNGTFAWQSITNAINPFRARRLDVPTVVTDPGANLHDDFNTTTGDKDVYVENTGTDPVYVRIKLQELLDKTSNQAPATPTWVTHIPDVNVEDCDGNFHDAYSEQVGGGFEWTMGNVEERNYRSIIGTTAWNSAADREEKDKLVADAFGDAQTADRVNTSAGTIKRLPACEVITMAEYNDLPNKVSFEGWVYDTDGYAYWSQRLQIGETTGLLLDKVSFPWDETYYYAINVTMEYVDSADLASWLDGSEVIKEGSNAGQTTAEASEDAKAMLRAMPELNWAKFKEVGARFQASGWEWVVIAIEGDDALVTTTNVIGTIEFNLAESPQGNSNAYNGSRLDNTLRRFYNNIVKFDEISGLTRITSVAQPSDFATKIPTYAQRNTNLGLSKVDIDGDKTFFALSEIEIASYLIGTGFINAARPSDSKVPDGFDNNFIRNGFEIYWSRTPGSLFNTVAVRNIMGNQWIAQSPTATNISVRPALWINMQ